MTMVFVEQTLAKPVCLVTGVFKGAERKLKLSWGRAILILRSREQKLNLYGPGSSNDASEVNRATLQLVWSREQQ